jgi:putative endonuclease
MSKQFHVYIMTNRSRTLYPSVTGHLRQRVYGRRTKLVPGFASRHNITRLVSYEEYPDARSAIEAEKRINGWLREKKIALIESMNPEWKNLSADWYSHVPEERPAR